MMVHSIDDGPDIVRLPLPFKYEPPDKILLIWLFPRTFISPLMSKSLYIVRVTLSLINSRKMMRPCPLLTIERRLLYYVKDRTRWKCLTLKRMENVLPDHREVVNKKRFPETHRLFDVSLIISFCVVILCCDRFEKTSYSPENRSLWLL